MSTPTRTPETSLSPVTPIPTRRPLPRWFTGAVFAGLAVVAVLLGLLTELSLVLLVVLLAMLGTIVVVGTSRVVEGGRKATDRFVTCLVYGAFLIAMVPLVSLIWTVISKGTARLDSEFFNSSMVGIVGPGGGIYHAIWGTLIITGITAVMSIPVGLLTAIYLVEYGTGRLKQWITFLVDVMTGIPSIVAGLFAYALFVIFFGPGVRMGFAGAVALSVLMIPVVVRSSEEVLKLVPNELREASYALGVPKWRTVVKVVLPTALAGLGTAVTLATARIIGETAPLLVTTGVIDSISANPCQGRMQNLAVYAYSEYRTPGVMKQASYDRAWAAALLLILIVMVLNLVARIIYNRYRPETR